MRKVSKKQIALFILMLLVAAAGFWGVRWATFARPPLSEAVEALEGDTLVAVAYRPWLTFSPISTIAETGFIFYPGGRIDPRGYAPLMKAIASAGYLVVVPEMPLNMAPFRPNVADEIVAAYPDIRHWVIGGHSVGGTMAAQHTHTHRDTISGLVIWASYPADNADLADVDIPVMLIYGSRDPRVNDDSVASRQHLLPADACYVRIDGGDHHQFGSYEIKPQEHHAVIDRADQQAQIVEQTLNLLQAASETK
ncbi:MAG: alpha/beta hydrolase [Anaerolineae bacterium]|nr:alpha/beta hydrolase [Anaerolineae bacterium]